MNLKFLPDVLANLESNRTHRRISLADRHWCRKMDVRVNGTDAPIRTAVPILATCWVRRLPTPLTAGAITAAITAMPWGGRRGNVISRTIYFSAPALPAGRGQSTRVAVRQA